MKTLSDTDFLAEPVTSPRDHILGPNSAPITVVEYGDYECPDCLNALPVLAAVRSAIGDKLRLVFRHFPQSSIHPHSSVAAQAAEAAALQGKFWEMHAALFAHQKDLGRIDFDHLALNIGLEIYKFETDWNSEQTHRRVRADYESGFRSGVKKTPTLFINSKKYEGAIEAESIISASRREL